MPFNVHTHTVAVMALDPIAYRPYADPDEFIREVTDLIWVQRDINHIVENYEPDSIVHGGLGTTTDRAGVITAGLLRLHAARLAVVAREQRLRQRFTAAHPDVATAVVPALATDVHDLEWLRLVGHLLAG